MAALTKDIDFIHDSAFPALRIQLPAAGADAFFRGALGFIAPGTGKLHVVPATGSEFVGFIDEHKDVTAADQLVWVVTCCRALVSAAAITHANYGALLYGLATSDNPADITATAAANSGAIGIVDQVEVSGTRGWVNTFFRSTIANVA